MKKTYFMLAFNISIRLLSCLILIGGLNLLTQFMALIISKGTPKTSDSSLSKFSESVVQYLGLGSSAFRDVAFILAVIVSLIIFRELYYRLRKDSLKNLYFSIRGTLKLRKFLRQVETLKNPEDKISSSDIITSNYNKAIRKVVVDINNETLLLYIKLPKQHQAQKMLKEMYPEIKEEVSNDYPEYLISVFERYKNSLWLRGTRR